MAYPLWIKRIMREYPFWMRESDFTISNGTFLINPVGAIASIITTYDPVFGTMALFGK
ncbi:MAG: hypothetical protein AAFX53_12420 [Bacteroidota bacterium]